MNIINRGLRIAVYAIVVLTAPAGAQSPTKDPVALCVPPNVAKELQSYQQRIDQMPNAYYEGIAKALSCILKESPLVLTENKYRTLKFVALSQGAIGPHWIRTNSNAKTFDMQGMVYMQGDMQRFCMWKYQNVASTFKGVHGTMQCIRTGDRTPSNLTPEQSQGWLEDQFDALLENVLADVIAVHKK